MDFEERAASLVDDIKNNRLHDYELIKKVCSLFDCAQNCNLGEGDYSFLRYLSTYIGIPNYYDLLRKLNDIENETLNLLDFANEVKNAQLFYGKEYLHIYQLYILNKFNHNNKNRYLLTAPTSFGKTFLLYKVIEKMKYRNVVLIFPTIALLSENQSKLLNNKNDGFWSKYKIITLSDGEIGENNIFIFTPERFLSYVDKHNDVRFDFGFMDEIYKIDNQYYQEDQELHENERDVVFRIALKILCNISDDLLLAGPYLKMGSKSLNNFRHENNIQDLDYNRYEIVNKNEYPLFSKNEPIDFCGDTITNTTNDLDTNLEKLIPQLLLHGNVLIYAGTKRRTRTICKHLCSLNFGNNTEDESYEMFLNHIKTVFGEDWSFYQALVHRVGYHNSNVPKYIQKELIHFFNNNIIKVLVCTTTITEGVNTTAKNIVITSSKKGEKILKQFDSQNIAGRAGRFNVHYFGNVFFMDKDAWTIYKGQSDRLNHKNYDIDSIKDDVDLFITDDKYLNRESIDKKTQIEKMASDEQAPQILIEKYKSIDPTKKIKMYSLLKSLSKKEINEILELGATFATFKNLNIRLFDKVLGYIFRIFDNESIKGEYDNKINGKNVSVLGIKCKSYLEKGFLGCLEYFKYKYKGKKSTDTIVNEVTNLVFSTFKYTMPKLLGVFDFVYRIVVSDGSDNIDETPGLGSLINAFERHADTEEAKFADDYGAPYRVIEYFDKGDDKIKNNFDNYELKKYNEIFNLLKK